MNHDLLCMTAIIAVLFIMAAASGELEKFLGEKPQDPAIRIFVNH